MRFQHKIKELLETLQKGTPIEQGPNINFKGAMPVGFYGGGMTNARPPMLVQSKKKKNKKITKKTT